MQLNVFNYHYFFLNAYKYNNDQTRYACHRQRKQPREIPAVKLFLHLRERRRVKRGIPRLLCVAHCGFIIVFVISGVSKTI